jgi:SAM-dependent methyltransferase
MYPHLEVIGVDASAARIEQAQANLAGLTNASVQVADATDLPFEDDCFDRVYSRFMLEYLPDKQAAVQEMARVARPGGKVLLQDLDGQLAWHYPEDADLSARIHQVLEALAQTGFDPFVGRKLYTMAFQAGLKDIQVSVQPYHLYAGRIDDRFLNSWELKLDIAAPAISRVLGAAQAATYKNQFLNYLQRDDTFTYSVLISVTAIKR